MTDELQNYNLQLQQVDVALLADPENVDLLQLKKDLDEVVALTQDLVNAQQESNKKSSYIVSTANDAVEAAVLWAAEQPEPAVKAWMAGDRCSAKWSEDGVYYAATVDSVADDGNVIVVFDAFQNRNNTTLKELRPAASASGSEAFPLNKQKRTKDKEYLRRKKQKKQQRMQELEMDRETDKNKWLNFKAKGATKSVAVKTKSIFATTEHANGRVGVGTCGVSGKPMTEFTRGESYKKGM